MALLTTIQAESGVLQNDATIVSDAQSSPSGSNNAVSIAAGPQNLNLAVSVPSGATKLKIFIKRISSLSNGTLNMNIPGSSLFGVLSASVTTDGLQAFEYTSLPISGVWNFDGSNYLIDRLEFHDNTVATQSNIVQVSGSILGKGSGFVKFRNDGPDAKAIGNTIDFQVSINNSSSSITSPTCSKGTILSIGANQWRLTLTSAIAVGEQFDVNFNCSTTLAKATIVTFDVIASTNETSLTDDTATATFVPSTDLSATFVSATSTAYAFKVRNNGTDDIEAGQVIRIVRANLPSGVATTQKGNVAAVGSDIDITLTSNLAVNEEFTVTVTLTTASTVGYSGTVTTQWQSNVADSNSANNTAGIIYSVGGSGGSSSSGGGSSTTIATPTVTASKQSNVWWIAIPIVLAVGLFTWVFVRKRNKK